MNKQSILSQLKEQYPGKKILSLPEDNPTEFLCEIEPTSDHPEYSVAIAIIDKSSPHVHHQTTETYKVIKGKLTVYKNDQSFELNEGSTLVITPGEVHWAQGDETWVECLSEPGWTSEDHILITEDK